MRLSLNNKDIINLLSNTGKLSANEFYKKLDKTIKNNIGHRLFTLTVVDHSIKYVERVYSNNTKAKSKKDQDLIQILMGDEVAPRKDFIINRALEVSNLDI